MRSPVEAGSIPYSAVTQPRPLPAIHLGTSSFTEAVQITRVPPMEISADPVALRMKPGSIAISRSSSGARPSFLIRQPPSGLRTSTWRTSPIGSWRNLLPRRRNSSGSPVARKRYSPRRSSSFSRPAGPQRRLHVGRDRLARADDGHPAAELALDHGARQRVVRAAQDHGVHVLLLQRRAGLLNGLDHALVHLAALLDQGRQLRAGHRVQLHAAAVRRGKRPFVCAAGHGGRRGQ